MFGAVKSFEYPTTSWISAGVLVDDIEVDCISMWEVSKRYAREGGEEPKSLEFDELNNLALGRDYRLPAAYIMAIRFTNPNPTDADVSIMLSGYFWYKWWKEKDPNLDVCVRDLGLLKRDVESVLMPSTVIASGSK